MDETVIQGARQGERKGREVITIFGLLPCTAVYIGLERMNTAVIEKKEGKRKKVKLFHPRNPKQ